MDRKRWTMLLWNYLRCSAVEGPARAALGVDDLGVNSLENAVLALPPPTKPLGGISGLGGLSICARLWGSS